MAEEEKSSEDKTEEPTQKRLQDAFKKGQVPFSREVASALLLFLLAINIYFLAPFYAKHTAKTLSFFFTHIADIKFDKDLIEKLGAGTIAQIIKNAILEVLIFFSIPLLLTMFMALFASFVQNGIVFAAESIKPKLEKISIVKGFKRLFSLKSFMEFLKGIIKITIIAVVSYIIIKKELNKILNISDDSTLAILQYIMTISFKIAIISASIMLVLSVMDLIYQKYEFIKSMRMTRKELKDEFKDTEGDPHVKARIRRIRMERASQRMMQDVKQADVVIRNPTHFAVALSYKQGMNAPIVLALGQDFLAKQIIEQAKKYNIPEFHRPELARNLFFSANLGEEIPIEYYEAVAEIIKYIIKLDD